MLPDAYVIQARLRPAALAISPAVVAILLLLPEHAAIIRIVGALIIWCGVTWFLAHVARTKGRQMQDGLYKSWGGKPTTAIMRRTDSRIDEATKQRYFGFLQANVPGWTAPTAADELRDPAAADQRYDSAVTWLLSFTRDRKTHPLVFTENVAYGFRRNLLGMKAIGLTVALASAAWAGTSIGLAGIAVVPATAWLALAYGLLGALAWTIVTPTWVRDAADAYAIRLIAACEMQVAPPVTRRAPRTTPRKQAS